LSNGLKNYKDKIKIVHLKLLRKQIKVIHFIM
jgi:hypothetical protein